MNKHKSIANPSAAAGKSVQLPDPADLMAVVSHYQSSLLRYVGKMLGTTDHETEDIVQETFVRLHLQVSRKGRQSVRNLTTWLFKTAQNLTIDTFRKRARQIKTTKTTDKSAKLAQEPAASELDALGEVLRQEARQVALRELGKLDEQHRQVVLLKVIQSMTLKQVAEVVGISIALANYRLNKGLAELARRLQKAGVV